MKASTRTNLSLLREAAYRGIYSATGQRFNDVRESVHGATRYELRDCYTGMWHAAQSTYTDHNGRKIDDLLSR